MIALQEALARISAHTSALAPVSVGLSQSLGRRLAEPLQARLTQPPFDASAMDGYAVRSSDLTGLPLRLVDESRAGHASSHVLAAGQTIRVSTGAVLPAGADQVVIQENARRDANTVQFDAKTHPGQHIRRAGLDFQAGETVLEAGTRLEARHISLAAAAGYASLPVFPAPRVVLVTTGDELVAPGTQPADGQIIDSLTPGLGLRLAQWGGELVSTHHARDDRGAVSRLLRDAAQSADLIVTVGGASVGDHDHLRPAFASLGGDLVFEKIRVRPGKPTWFGRLGKTRVLGLPGNPVSAWVMAEITLRHILAVLQGGSDLPLYATAELGADLEANGNRAHFMRARRDAAGRIHPVDTQDSSALTRLIRADGLIVREVDAPAASAGSPIEWLDFTR